VAGNGPDSKTIERYLEALCRHGKAQKLVIPVTLTTSTVVTKDMLAYVKPHVQVNDALIEQVLIVFPLLPVLLFPPCLPACLSPIPLLPLLLFPPCLPACVPFPLLPCWHLSYFCCLASAPLAGPRPFLHSDPLILFPCLPCLWLMASFLHVSSSFPVDSLYFFLYCTCSCMDHGL